MNNEEVLSELQSIKKYLTANRFGKDELWRKLDMLDLARMVGHTDPRSLMIYYNATASEMAKRLD